MSEESTLHAVNLFRQIKNKTECDDMTAAILALAQSVSYIETTLQFSDTGNPERLGGDIGNAINNIAKDGLNVMVSGLTSNPPPKAWEAPKPSPKKSTRRPK